MGDRQVSTSTTPAPEKKQPQASLIWQQTGMQTRMHSREHGPEFSSGIHQGLAPLCCTMSREKGA
ncbi:MAG: hypothetical protein GXY67_02190 [Clostridiales bacterium]|nr:hypothetical protein [Clostridiales bacterium]